MLTDETCDKFILHMAHHAGDTKSNGPASKPAKPAKPDLDIQGMVCLHPGVLFRPNARSAQQAHTHSSNLQN